MLALITCGLVFILSYMVGRRSLAHGLGVVLASGYFYGILRAHLNSGFGHFIFDFAVLGLYFSQSWVESESKKVGGVRTYVILLIGWPLLVCLLPFQSPMISLVGLRANAFLIPVLLLGTRLTSKDLLRMGDWLAVLNIGALAFALAEYFMGLERFFPL